MYYRLYSQPLYLRYSNSVWSVAFWINALILVATFVISYILVYRTGDMWRQIDWSRHTVEMKFKDQIWLRAEIQVEGEKSPQTLIWSSSTSLNERLQSNKIRIPSFYVSNRLLAKSISNQIFIFLIS